MERIELSSDKNTDRTINRISAAKKRGKCFVNFVDDSYIMLERDLVFEYALNKNMILDHALLSEIMLKEELINAKKAGMTYATYALRTEQQVRLKLTTQGYSNSIISTVVSFLKDFGYLSDTLFAEQFVKAKIQRRHYGFLRIKRELSLKGVCDSIIHDILSKEYPSAIAYEVAVKSAEKKLRSISFHDDKKKHDLVRAHLYRQGFDASIIKEVLKTIS